MEVNNATAPAVATTDSRKLNADFDDFLNLLTTQLKNQDPLSPMDSTEFTNQLVQFSNVEQNIKTNGYLEKLLTMQTLNLTALGVSFIGKDVEVGGDQFQMDGTKTAALTYIMAGTATTGNISIANENGDVVYTSTAELSAGQHEFVWNGNDLGGTPVPAGTYTLRVGALNAEGGALNVATFVPGHVNGLESADDGSLLLNINGLKIPLTDVRKIFEPTT